MITIEDLEKADDLAAKTAMASVESVWKADMLKETGKDFLAQIMTDIRAMKGEEKISETELERLARSHPKWIQFRDGQFEAQKVALQEKVSAQNAQRHFEACQSILSYRREEFKRLGT